MDKQLHFHPPNLKMAIAMGQKLGVDSHSTLPGLEHMMSTYVASSHAISRVQTIMPLLLTHVFYATSCALHPLFGIDL
jgi:hypothetical protein